MLHRKVQIGHPAIAKSSAEHEAEKEMVLLIEAVVSAFKIAVWGRHMCGSWKVTWVSFYLLPWFAAGSLCVVFPLCTAWQLALKLLGIFLLLPYPSS